MDITGIRRAFLEGRVEWREHTLIRPLERNISRDDIARVVEQGEIIEEYQAGQGLPSCLIY